MEYFIALKSKFDNTNQVTQDAIPKFKQSSIISEKPGYLSQKLKILRSFNCHKA